MSQEKVDKRKYEKYHRKEIQRKQKIKNTVFAVIAVLILGTAIGIPLGYKIYDSMPKTISSLVLDAWVSNYVKGLDGYPFVVAEEDSTAEDTTSSDNTTAEDATADTTEADTAEDATVDTTEADTAENVTADTTESDTNENATDTAAEDDADSAEAAEE